MTTFNKIVFVCAMVGLTACKETMSGPVVITKDLPYVDMQGNSQVMPAGQYSPQSSLTVYDKKPAVLEIYNDRTLTKSWIQFLVPEELKNDLNQSQITLRPDQIGQPFGIKASSVIQERKSPPQQKIESCVYDRYVVPVCDRISRRECFRDGFGRTHCRTYWDTICHDEIRYVYGSRDLTIVLTYRQRDLTIRMMDAQFASEYGTFSHVLQLPTQTDVINSGPCIR